MASSLLQEISALDSQDPLQNLVDATLRLTEADRVVLILFDWEAKEVRHFLRGGPGWPEVMTTVGFDELSAGLSGWALREAQIAYSPKDLPDPRESPEVQKRRRDTHCGSILVAPLITRGGPLGTMTAINRLDQEDFSPEKREQFSLLALYAARVIELEQSKTSADKARLEASTAIKSKLNFLSNLSHELRTPLNGILGFSSLLDSTILDPAQKNMVHTIVQSGQRLLATVDNILELAQLEAGQFHLENSPFSPRMVLDSVVARYRELAADKPIDWKVTLDPNLPPILEGDAVRLGQAWNHVLSNAVKFTDQGAITVHLEALEPFPGQHKLILNVQDTGIGLDSDRAGKWFVPFHQEDGSLTRKFGGTGLGLALCDRITRQMGGGISLYGEPQAGTKVRVWVHLGSGISPESPPAGNYRILLEDSDPVSRLVLVKLLEKERHRVDIAFDLDQALERVRSSPYEIVIVGMEDSEAPQLRHLEAEAAEHGYHLIGLSPVGSAVNQQRTTPWSGYLLKPASYLDVKTVLSQCTPRKKR